MRFFPLIVPPASPLLLHYYASHSLAFSSFAAVESYRVPAEFSTYASLLRRYGDSKALADGKQLHRHLAHVGLDEDRFLGNLILQMYCKCGAFEEARLFFCSLPERNVFSWNFIIRGFSHQGLLDEALQFFLQMLHEGVHPDKVTYLSVLAAHGGLSSRSFGKQLHACILHDGFVDDLPVSTALINMYNKCGSVDDARKVFHGIVDPDVVMWTAMIAVHDNHGCFEAALQLFDQMKQEAVMPDKVTFLGFLDVCANHAALAEGKCLHACMLYSHIKLDAAVSTALLHMYERCGKLENVSEVFEDMSDRNVVSWTVMIAAHAQQGHAKEILQLVEQMHLEGIKPNTVTFTTILAASCSHCMAITGQCIHMLIVDQGLEMDTILGNALVNMYGKCGYVQDAWNIFRQMPAPDVVSWTTIMMSLIQQGQGKEALKLFKEMRSKGITPDKFAFASILDACSSHGTLCEGKEIHACIRDVGLELDIVVANALINMYGSCGSLEDAQKLFDSMPVRDVFSFNTIISFYAQKGMSKIVVQLFEQMHLEGKNPDKITFMNLLCACERTASLASGGILHSFIVENECASDVALTTNLLTMYGRCGRLRDARSLFDRLHDKDVISWNAMITVYAQNGCDRYAWQLFHGMQQKGLLPDQLSFINILGVCATSNLLAEGKQVHVYILGSRLDAEVMVGNALVNFYGECGSLEYACRLFDQILDRSIISWNALLGSYAQHGCGEQVYHLFQRMQSEGFEPNEVTFLSLLVACSHAGLVDLGTSCFIAMREKFGILPRMDHHVCVFDLLVRAGCWDKAKSMINNFPFQPTIETFIVLLGACGCDPDDDWNSFVADHVRKLDVNHTYSPN